MNHLIHHRAQLALSEIERHPVTFNYVHSETKVVWFLGYRARYSGRTRLTSLTSGRRWFLTSLYQIVS